MQTSTSSLLIVTICCLASLAAAASAFYSWHNKAVPRIAYIDTDKLLNSYQAMLTARHQYQREKQEWQRNLTTLSDEARRATGHAQQMVSGISSAEKLTRAREAKLKQEQFLNYQQAVAKQEPQEMQRLTEPVIVAVNRYIATYSRQNHYDLILTTAGQGDIVYSNAKLDITTDVATQLNKYLADSLAHTSGAGGHKPLAGQP